jgi:hypothetical protein
LITAAPVPALSAGNLPRSSIDPKEESNTIAAAVRIAEESSTKNARLARKGAPYFTTNVIKVSELDFNWMAYWGCVHSKSQMGKIQVASYNLRLLNRLATSPAIDLTFVTSGPFLSLHDSCNEHKKAVIALPE